MSKIKVTLPGLEIPVTGKQVSFKAPCDCSAVDYIQIDGVDYTVVDALGRQVTGSPKGGTWASGAQVSVILDCENKKAYLQNGNVTPDIIGAAYRPNLLHNWYFADPVNQRGKTEYAGSMYTIDRWKSNSGSVTCKVVLENDGLSIIAGTSNAYLNQYHECLVSRLLGEKFVLSILLSDGQLLTQKGSFPAELPSSETELTRIPLPASAGIIYALVDANDRFRVNFAVTTGKSIKVKAVKLELGSTQTLAHQDASGKWVLNEIPNYSEELLKCIQSTADSSDEYANKVIYHTGNKPTAADVGAVNKAGDTMTGALTVRQRISAEFPDVVTAKLEAHSSGAVDLQKVSTDGKYAAVRLNATTDLAKRLALCGNDTGSWFDYTILHTGNMDSLLSNNSRAKIATGSYIGTGTYGENNPNSIVCGFKPKMFIIAPADANVAATCVWVSPATSGIVDSYRHSSSSASEESVTLVWNDDGMSWYFDAGSYYENVGYSIQMNDSDKVYYWCAIG